MSIFIEIAVFLAAAVIAVPIFRWLKLGSVLAYLTAGVAIGPWGLGVVDSDTKEVLHFGEIGVVFLLFVIGLELRPSRLKALRRTIFAPGAAQVLGSAALITLAAALLGLGWRAALVVGLALSLSSTAFVLQLLTERDELTTAHGRGAFGVLLFQDLAVVPMIALMPLLAPGDVDASLGAIVFETGRVLAVITAFVVGGHFLLRPIFRLVAKADQHEVFIAAALLLVLGSALLMESVGISMSLGAFIAGVLVADSEYRHQLEADLEPFKGLLLGLFFMAVGMVTDVGLLISEPLTVLGLALGLMTVKAAVLAIVASVEGFRGRDVARFSAVLAQGGEFAFVLLGAAAGQALLRDALVDRLTLVVTVSMAATVPLVALVHKLLDKPPTKANYDDVTERPYPVFIAGFGRFGQVVARILASRGIPFTALEISPGLVDFVRQFGNKIYYGDASRVDLLRNAGVEQAEVFVIAVDDVETSMNIAETVRHHFPHLKICARARNRQHAHRLMGLGCHAIMRETFLSSSWLGGEVLKALGVEVEEADQAVAIFRGHDEETLIQQYPLRHDRDALIQSNHEAARELRELFTWDAAERGKEPPAAEDPEADPPPNQWQEDDTRG
jgi:glutathione-regulated potassium-efflux system ancillary protein KefC/glutathione-regulated potassium-efflux system protein KefB